MSKGMSDSETKIRNIMVYLIPLVVANLLPIITLPVMTRFLTPADFGVVALATGITSLIANFIACNMVAAVQRYYFQYRHNKEDLCRLINSSLLFLFIIFAISMPFMLISVNSISRIIMGSTSYAWPVFMAYLGCILSILTNLYLLLYRNMEKAKNFSFYTLLQTILNISLSVVLAVIFKAGYMSLIYATVFSSGIVFIVLFVSFIRDYPFKLSYRMLADNLIYGIPLLPGLFISSISQFFDKYLLRSFVSFSSTGIFSIAQNISNKMFIFMTAVQSTFHPIFMKDMFDKGKEGAVSVGRNFTVFTYISLAAILPAILFAEEIIYILAPRSYYSIITVIMVVLSGIAVQAFGKIVGAQLDYIKKAYLSFPISIVGLITNIGLNLFLIPKFEAMGAALAMISTIFITNFIYINIAQRYYRIVYDKRMLFWVYADVFISTLLLIYFRIFGLFWPIKYLVKLVSLGIFVMIGIKANILSKENLKILFKILTFKKAQNGSEVGLTVN